jgi:hypothetical protein
MFPDCGDHGVGLVKDGRERVAIVPQILFRGLGSPNAVLVNDKETHTFPLRKRAVHGGLELIGYRGNVSQILQRSLPNGRVRAAAQETASVAEIKARRAVREDRQRYHRLRITGLHQHGDRIVARGTDVVWCDRQHFLAKSDIDIGELVLAGWRLRTIVATSATTKQPREEAHARVPSTSRVN